MDKFFQICGEVGQHEQIEELLLHRYGSGIDYILRMPIPEAVGFIAKAIKAETEDRLYRQWLAYLPHFSQENYISFSDFRDRMTGANIDKRPTEEILAEVAEIKERFANGS